MGDGLNLSRLWPALQSVAGHLGRLFVGSPPIAPPDQHPESPHRTVERVKRSAIPYAGYEYQTLQGVRLLAFWLTTPTCFRRVRFEADADLAPQGLDDIVCEREDGRYDFLQVKFSPSPDKPENQLTWDWLLVKDSSRPRARSLVRKWFDAVKKVSPDSIGDVSLLTNRIPDPEVSACFAGEHLDYTRASDDVQQRLCDELDGADSAKAFLQRLKVRHSDKSYLTLGREVAEALRKHTDDAGVHRLRSHAREWAIFKACPQPDGWITLEIVRALLSSRRPEPIPEDFAIPDDYVVPDTEFHNELKAAIAKSDGEAIVITGPPGRGKSTYLSFLCSELESEGIPLVRHHYFMSLTDRTDDRLSPRVVAEALLAQIASVHGDAGAAVERPEHLAAALQRCAEHYLEAGKPFVVVMDGLDHVWRDNGKDTGPLDELFKQILPVPNNMVLLVGTQPVDDDNLPDRLIGLCPRDGWRLLPPMSGNALMGYLRNQVEAGRLQVNREADMLEDAISECATALHALTQGHPLHVIYAVEELAAANRLLSSWEIEKLSPCPGPDIRSYYGELWRKLTERQQDVLHLCCGFPFLWPRSAFAEMRLDDGASTPSVRHVEHLLYSTSVGLKPFHESLVIFVREQQHHGVRITELSVTVRDWLASQAPVALRQSWLWSLELRLGNLQPMLDGLTRDWVLDRLAEGYQTETMVRLHAEAEEAMFRMRDYATANRFRAFKTRLLNGPEFQISEAWRLQQCSWSLSYDASVVDYTVANRHELSQQSLGALGLALAWRNDQSAKTIGYEVLARHRRETLLQQHRHNQDVLRDSSLILEVGTILESLDLERISADGRLGDWPSEYVATLCRTLSSVGDIKQIMYLWTRATADDVRSSLESAAVVAARACGADVSAWKEFAGFGASSLAACWGAVIGFSLPKLPSNPIPQIIKRGVRDSLLSDASKEQVCEWFFKSLLTRLKSDGAFSWLKPPKVESEPNAPQYLDALTQLADEVASRLLLKQPVRFEDAFIFFDSENFHKPTGFEQHQVRAAVSRALPDIAVGCHLLGTMAAEAWHVGRPNLVVAQSSSWFSLDMVRSWCVNFEIKLLADDAVEFLVDETLRRHANTLEETNQRVEALLELTILATRHRLQEPARRTCRLCWDYVLGYISHKDPTILTLLEAIDYLSLGDSRAALSALVSVGPQIAGITEYTDGDETRHAHRHVSELLARLGIKRLALQYGEESRKGNWHRADGALSALVEFGDLSSDVAASLARTGLPPAALTQLSDRAKGGESRAQVLIVEALAHLGADATSYSEREHGGSSHELKNFEDSPADYPPERYEELRAAMSGMYGQRDYLLTWFEYWKSMGRESDLLRVLKLVLLDGELKFDDWRYLLDPLFIASLRLEGPDRAFEIAVKAQIELGGWSGHMFERSERSEARLTRIAEVYPARADEFIQKSCKTWLTSGRQPSKLVIPSEKLVFFLIKLKRFDEAKELVRVLCGSLHEDTRNMHLEVPAWAVTLGTDSKADEPWLHMLVERLRWPVPSVKWWVLQELATFLATEQWRHKTEEVLLEHLAACRFESEVVEVMAAFWLAKQRGYPGSNVIGKHVTAKSTLSSMMLADVASGSHYEGQLSAELILAPPEFEGPQDFKTAQGATVPLMYQSEMARWEKKTGLPLKAQYAFEWARSLQRVGNEGHDWQYFYGYPREQMTGQFFTQQSHRGRSAYLRTVLVAQRFWDMPNNYAEHIAMRALPIDPTLAWLRPVRPEWLAKWNLASTCDGTSIAAYLSSCITEFNSMHSGSLLASLCLPVAVGDREWIELNCVLWAQWEDAEPDPMALLAEQQDRRSAGWSLGNSLDCVTTYDIAPLAERQGSSTAAPVVGGVLPLRYGVLHSDVEQRGWNVPLLSRLGATLAASPNGAEVEFSVDEKPIGRAGYWNVEWEPAHPSKLGPFCGTFTALYADGLEALFDTPPVRTFYLWEAKRVRLKEVFDEPEVEALCGTVNGREMSGG